MAMFDILFPQKYENSQGEEKTSWHKIGKLFLSDDGKKSIKMDTMPVGAEWNGWLVVKEPKPRDNAPDPFG